MTTPTIQLTLLSEARCETFAELFRHLKMFTEHVNLCFERERLYVQAMDRSHVCILDIQLPSTWFDTYVLQEPLTIGINATHLFHILNAKEKQQTLTMEHTVETDHLYLHWTNEVKTKATFDKHFELPLIALEMDIMDIPSVEYQATFELGSSHMAALMNQLKLFGETLEIECSEECIIWTSHSVEKGKMKVDIQIDELVAFSINEGQTVDLSFSLNYLGQFAQYNKLSKTVEINLSEGLPLKAVYFLDDVITEDSTFRAQLAFYLAPREL